MTVYGTRYTLDSEVLEYVSVDALKNLDSVVEEMGVNFVQVRADQSGIVSYMVDSLEGVDPNQVTEEMFDRSGYTKNILKSGKLVGVGEPAYKLVTSSDWSLVFQMTEEDAALYNGKTALTVKFAGKDLKTPRRIFHDHRRGREDLRKAGLFQIYGAVHFRPFCGF